MSRVFKGLLYGIGAGVCVTLGLYALEIVVELLSCTCNILTGDCNKKTAEIEFITNTSFWSLLGVCVAGGAVIGTIYGIVKAAQDSRNAKDMRLAKNLEAEKTFSANVISLADRVAAQEMHAVPTTSPTASKYRGEATRRLSESQKKLEDAAAISVLRKK